MGKNRKTKKIKRRMRRRGPGLFLTLFCFAVICAAIVAAVTVFFKVESIEVIGETRYSDEEIIQALGVKMGENMFSINKFAAIERLLEQCPYADKVVIRRALPNKLKIHLQEAVPAIQIESGGAWYVADINGRILEKTQAISTSLGCVVTGAELIDPVVSQKIIFLQKEKENPIYNILKVAKNNDILNKVNKINIEKVYEIEIGYTERFTVLLGTVENIEQKIKVLGKVVETVGASQSGTIDVADPAKVYFRPY